MKKIGVANVGSDRLAKHFRRGWHLADIWECDTGAEATGVESAVLLWWRTNLGIPDAVAADDMPQGGHTETASRTLVSIEDIQLFIYYRLENGLNDLTADPNSTPAAPPTFSPVPRGLRR